MIRKLLHVTERAPINHLHMWCNDCLISISRILCLNQYKIKIFIITHLLRSTFFLLIAKRNRSGVDISTSHGNVEKSAFLERCLVINLIRNFFPLTSFLHSRYIWADNSRVWQRITARMPPFEGACKHGWL